MAKLPVALQKIFAGALTPSGNIAQPGSTLSGTPVYSADPATLQALAAWVNGYQAQLINAPGGLSSPVLEELNGILLVLSYQIAYLKQAGIAEWDPSVTYYIGSWVQVAGVPYISLTDGNLNNAVTNPTYWQTFVSTLSGASDTQLKAWVIFDGRTGAIDESYGVSGVGKAGAGVYLINFSAPFTNATSYGFVGSAATRPGQAFISGDDNVICGGVRGLTPLRNQNTCTVYCFDRPLGANEDSSLISLQFFGR